MIGSFFKINKVFFSPALSLLQKQIIKRKNLQMTECTEQIASRLDSQDFFLGAAVGLEAQSIKRRNWRINYMVREGHRLIQGFLGSAVTLGKSARG